MAYHHHMGSIIENEDDVNWLMEGSSSDLSLCFDTGHLLFGGGDVMATLDRWGDRIHHVHYKDIRPDIVKDIRENNKSFLDAVIDGAFRRFGSTYDKCGTCINGADPFIAV